MPMSKLLAAAAAAAAVAAAAAAPQEMHEFNLEDTSRVAWDPMLRKAWLLQSGKAVEQTAEQLVVYLRR
jgi:hypothetical protein